VTLTCVQGQLPPPLGGTIVNGIYIIASETYYGATCPASETDRPRWLVCGTTWQTLQDSTTSGGTEMINADNFNVTQNGTALTLQGVCGVTSSYTFGFSAAPTTLTLYIGTPNSPGEGRVDVYALQ
jgi:hypothetical protein